MFSKISKRFTYANVAMTLALVFAMSGGAFAASKYLITSTKQISPKVLKSLVGKAGATGASGTQGSSGPAGPAGPSGPAGGKGETGVQGPQGPEGKEGPVGKNGANGKNGTTGFTETLPPGKTETGYIAAQELTPTENNLYVPISFPIPLKELISGNVYYEPADGLPPGKKENCEGDQGVELQECEKRKERAKIDEEEKKKFEENCPGDFEKPEAVPGSLCVYEVSGEGLSETNGGNELEKAPYILPSKGYIVQVVLFGKPQGTLTSGAVLDFFPHPSSGSGETKVEPETHYFTGTFAVTAPES